MPTTFTPGNKNQEDELNPGQRDYDQRFNDIARKEERGSFDDIVNNYDQDADSSQEDENIERARNGESNAAQGAPGAAAPWANRTSSQAGEQAKSFIKKITFKKAAPLLGATGIIGIIIFLLGGWLPTMLLPSLSQGAVSENDARGTLLERRLIAKLQQKMTDSGPCDTKLSLCRDKKMPKVMLSSMAKKGIVAVDAGGKPINVDGTGYMDTNPSHYSFTDKNGNTKIIAAGDFVNEYKSNPVFRKLFKGAYNTRYLSYTGGFMKKVLDKWGVKKDGGVLADSEFTEDKVNDKISEATKVGGADGEESGTKTKFRERAKLLFQRSADKVKKTNGDPILLVGTGVCMAIAMPTFVAGTIRAIQLAQVVALASNFILSSSDMLRAGDADPEQVSAAGKALTDTYPVEGSDVAKSAVDSTILLAATGAAGGAMLKPTKFVPGYALFSNPTIQGANQLNAATKETCNLINSPQAAIASAGITAAIGAASAGTGAAVLKALQAVGKVAAMFGAIDGLMILLEETGVLNLIADGAYNVAAGLIGNIYEDAKGIEFGDALGTGLFAVFSLAALGGGAAVLTKSQARSFNQVAAEVDNEYREEAIATLSPFDTSSQYTFLGNIVSKLALSTAGSSNMISSTISTLGSIVRAPFSLLNKAASAETDPIEAKYGYASYFGVDEDIAITIAGTPGVGMPTQYLDMNPETAYNLVSNSVNAETGEPNEPTPLLDNLGIGVNADLNTTIAECADADLESISGCTIAASASQTVESTSCGTEGEVCGEDDDLSTSSVTVQGDPDEARSAALRIYYMDHQIENMLSGNDEEESSTATTTTAGLTVDEPNLFTDSTQVTCAPGTTEVRNDTGYKSGSPIPVKLCSLPNTKLHNGSPALVNSRASGVAYAMFEQMKTDLGISTVTINDSFRTMAEQQEAKAAYGSQAADPGFSNHQMGFALDINMGSANAGTATSYVMNVNNSYPGNKPWEWLVANASKYHFSQFSKEGWHWSINGG